MNGLTLLNIYRNHTPSPDDVINRLSGRNMLLNKTGKETIQ